MKKYLYILSFLLIGSIYTSEAQAFVVKDALTKAEDVIEETIEVAKTVHEKVIAFEAKQRDTKLGKFGVDALNAYKDISEKLKQDRMLSGLDVPDFLKGSLLKIPSTEKVMKDEYMTNFGEGNDTTKVSEQNRKNMELQHNNIASVYAKAYTIRHYLADARKKEDPQVNLQNGREIIQAGRVYAEQTSRRLIDILTMEMALLEFENTQIIMDFDTKRNDMSNVMAEQAQEKKP